MKIADSHRWPLKIIITAGLALTLMTVSVFTNFHPFFQLANIIQAEIEKAFAHDVAIEKEIDVYPPFADMQVIVDHLPLSKSYVRTHANQQEVIKMTFTSETSALLQELNAMIKGDELLIDTVTLMQGDRVIMHQRPAKNMVRFEHLYIPVGKKAHSTFSLMMELRKNAPVGARIALAVSPHQVLFKKGFSTFRLPLEEPMISRYLTVIGHQSSEPF